MCAHVHACVCVCVCVNMCVCVWLQFGANLVVVGLV